MFRTIVRSTPFTSPGANELFRDRIDGENYNGDVSFVSTLRALLGPRTKEEDRVYIGFCTFNADRIVDETPSTVLRRIDGALAGEDCITVSNITTAFLKDDKKNGLMEKIAAAAKLKSSRNFTEFPEIAAFYKKVFNCLCLADKDKRVVSIFVENLDMRKLHYLQVSTLAMFPWYFSKDQSVTEDEMALIKSLRETKDDDYLAALTKLADAYDFRQLNIKKQLDGFELHQDKAKLENLNMQMENIERRIQDLMNRIGDQLRQKESTMINIMGLEKKLANPDHSNNELMDYFIANKKLILDRVEDSVVYFTVRDYIQYFDKEAAEHVINNPRSPFYGRTSSLPDEKIKALLTEIFLADKPRLKIRTCAAYSVSMELHDIHGQSHYNYSAECRDCLPNMHIEMHSCIGDYAQIFSELLIENNCIGIIEQCIASAKSLNFYDGTVINEFASAFVTGSSYSNRCIELPDGTVVKPADAIRWLEGWDEEKE